MYTKYEVSMSNPVPGRGVHRTDQANNANENNDDGQFMIV